MTIKARCMTKSSNLLLIPSNEQGQPATEKYVYHYGFHLLREDDPQGTNPLGTFSVNHQDEGNFVEGKVYNLNIAPTPV